MIKSNGGVFGRHPDFGTVTTQGSLSVGTTATVAGNVTITNGNVVVASGKGIDFSATAGTGTSELFADYEEGDWTPVYVPATGSFTTLTMDVVGARYVKIGRQVTVMAGIRTDNVDSTGASGVLRIGGLPFTNGPNRGAGSCSSVTLWNANMPSSLAIEQNGTLINMSYKSTANGNDSLMNVTDITTGANANYNNIWITCVYQV
jgi:hypothetical protein